MKLTDLNGKNICILGYGKEGQSMVEAIEKHGIKCTMTISDRNNLQPTNYKLQTGIDWLKNLDHFDILIKSPGIPTRMLKDASGQWLVASGQILTSSTQIFLDTIQDRGATVIGVTGSKGKSTTSSLIYAILKEAKKDVLLLGNIGEPAIAHLDDIKKGTTVVMEMSSYQLEHLSVSPHIAVVTSFFPDHLDHHGGLDSYLNAKTQITRHQKEEDVVFFNANDPMAAEIAKHGNGRKLLIDQEDCPVELSETQLIGEHNRTNIALAWKVCESLGIKEPVAKKAIKAFIPLPHRLQSLGIHNGIEWIDDSISTTPESAIAALNALEDRVFAMILGGQDRGVDFSPLKTRLQDSNVQLIVLLGESGKRIEAALSDVPLEIKKVQTMEEAVHIIATSYELRASGISRTTNPEPQTSNLIALLSPASPSYDMYKNFEEKGEAFAKSVVKE